MTTTLEHRYGFEETSGAYRLVLDGSTCIFTKEYDPTRLCSEMAGKLARLLVEDGAEVKAGDAIVELEVMKMYLSLKRLLSNATISSSSGVSWALPARRPRRLLRQPRPTTVPR